MLPPAPPRFSTTNGTLNLACMCWARRRPSRSAEPPAANGTTMETMRCGQEACADAGVSRARPPAAASPVRNSRRFIIVTPPLAPMSHSNSAASLLPPPPEPLRHLGDLRPLGGDRLGELLRAADVHHLPRRGEAVRDGLVGDRLDVIGD